MIHLSHPTSQKLQDRLHLLVALWSTWPGAFAHPQRPSELHEAIFRLAKVKKNSCAAARGNTSTDPYAACFAHRPPCHSHNRIAQTSPNMHGRNNANFKSGAKRPLCWQLVERTCGFRPRNRFKQPPHESCSPICGRSYFFVGLSLANPLLGVCPDDGPL